jgi:hypothetical protein
MKVLLRILCAAVCALLLSLSLERAAHAQLLSPGPLTKGHASLEGDTHCNDCHSSGKRVDQNLCLKCHADIRVATGQGLHGRQYKGQPCEKCHVDHLGSSTIKWPGGSPNAFDHGLTGWPLDGAHKTTCNKCHTKPSKTGGPTYLGLQTACTSCHKDPHAGRMPGCTDCHNATKWEQVNLKTFNHDLAAFKLKGAHATVQCAKCHQEPPKWRGLKFQACTDCHKDPHAGKLGASCTDCHDENKWKPASLKGGGFKHPGVSLANGHAPVACGRCHDKGNMVAPSRGSACVSCHRAVHKAPFGTGCVACHASITWFGMPRSVGLAAHAKTQYKLTGKHDDVACSGCHKPSLPEETRYRKLAFGRCLDCHADRHDKEFASRDSGECKTCHSTAGYRPTLFGVDLHASTKFALGGKHSAVPCSSCHKAPKPLLDLRLAKQACADCHANPHGDQFAAEMAKGGCAQCHQPTGWHVPKIDHKTWPLTGAHATTACEGCHHPSAEDRKTGQGASYRGVPRNCGGCHEDQHLGQFRLTAPIYECDKCHTTKAFKIQGFDHTAMTGWALTGAHAKTDCTKCHQTAALPNEKPTVRWRRTSHECNFCHANPHKEKPLTGQPKTAMVAQIGTTKATDGVAGGGAARSSLTEGVSCGTCHSTTAWKAKDAPAGASGGAKFDHAKTGFPLTGQHMSATCVQCHNNTAIKRDCVTCHTDFHLGRLSQSCDKCHSPTGWKVTKPFEMHRMTRLPLTGMHVLADCSQCHVRANEQRFTDAPADCYACHQKDLQKPGIFPHGSTPSRPALSRDCSQCHRPMGWVPVTATVTTEGTGSTSSALQAAPPNHDVRFPINFGKHRGLPCADCHVSQTATRSVRCVGCHAHDTVVLMQQHGKAIPTDGASCLSCHPGGVRR